MTPFPVAWRMKTRKARNRRDLGESLKFLAVSPSRQKSDADLSCVRQNEGMPEILCRHFSGYKPCGKSARCDQTCASQSIPTSRVLLIHLGAMGAVLRSTSLLAAIHRKFPGCHLTIVTTSPCHQFFINNSRVDRVLTTGHEDLLQLSCLEFDVALVVDKSLVAAGIAKIPKIKKIVGFRVESTTGSILPATHAAEELWQIGLSDEKKFFQNKKPETQLITEALELPYERDEYDVQLTSLETRKVNDRRQLWAPRGQVIVGINTGCSPVIPYKKLTAEMHRKIVVELTKLGVQVVLLGGPDDDERNSDIARGTEAIQSPTRSGLRDGMVSVAACDIVVSGDSLGMHMAIALKKWVVAWFGPTCAQEIDLFDRGAKIYTAAGCSPCWKRSCHRTPMCYDLVSLDQIIDGVRKGILWHASFSTPHLSETFCSPSPP